MKLRVSLEKAILDQLRLTMEFSGMQPIVFWLPRGKAGLASMIPNGFPMQMNVRFFGCYGWQQGKLHVALRTPDGPDAMDGVLTWSEDELVFDGAGVDFPGGHVVFRR